jgi:HEAT repeat protein
MEAGARTRRDAPEEALTPEQEALVRAVGAWVQQLARTLKNCRLYDPQNPAAVRFRQQLAEGLTALLDQQGDFTLRFTSDDVQCEGSSLYPAKSRDDNLALPFYRDGIRALTFRAGCDGRELNALLDGLLAAGSSDESEDDLVTRLWQERMPHLDVDVVPAEGDVGAAEGGETALWPTAAAAEVVAETPAAEAPADGGTAEARSDDWSIGERADEIEAGFAELEAVAAGEVARFRQEFEGERAQPQVTQAIAVVRAYAAAEATPADLAELGRFLPRVLRAAVHEGRWSDARHALGLLAAHPSAEWSAEPFVQEIQQPVSTAVIRDRLESQDPAAVAEFIAFALALGEVGVDLLHLVLANAAAEHVRSAVSESIVEASRSNPERLAPWLADPRPAVVRGVVRMLGAIGGRAIVPVLQAVAGHSDPTVRAELVAALQGSDPKAAQPLLVRFLSDPDPRVLCGALHHLSELRDPHVARRVLGLMIAEDFEHRSGEEKRAIYATLGATGGDDVVPELEAELLKGNWFQRSDDQHQQAVARCLWRIGTPAARAALENGARTRRPAVRALCEQMLARWEQRV